MTSERPLRMARQDLESQTSRAGIFESHKSRGRARIRREWLPTSFVEQGGQVREFGGKQVDERGVLLPEERCQVGQTLVRIE